MERFTDGAVAAGSPRNGNREPLERAPPFPEFPYHPDPRKTGSIVPSRCPCALCGHRYGFVYAGPVFASDDFVDGPLCPWCIADGSAALRLQIEFTDVGDDVPDDVPGGCSTRSPSARRASTAGSRSIGSTTAPTAPRSWARTEVAGETAYRFRCRHCGIGLAYTDSP